MHAIERKSLVLTIGLVLALCSASSAQTPTPTATPDDEVIKIDSRLVVVPVSVTDAAGSPITGLGIENFRLTEEGKVQTIERISPADNVPLEIALLFDVSATTSPMFKFQQETAAKFLLEVMRPEDRATIFTIGERPLLVHPRDTAAASVTAVRGIIPTKEYTAFYDTVASAAEYLNKNAPDRSRRVVVVISDGEDTNSTAIAKAINDGFRKAGQQLNTLDSKSLYQLTVANRDKASAAERVRVLKLLQNADTVFYSINPAGSSFQLNKISVFGQENMQKFADDTGGTAFLPKFLPIDAKDNYANSINMSKNGEVLDRIFRQLGNELRSQYLIQYYSETDMAVGKFVKLGVTLTGSQANRVRARQGYYVK